MGGLVMARPSRRLLLWLLAAALPMWVALACSRGEDPTDPSTPAVPVETRYDRRLTGTEAAELTREFLRDKAVELGLGAENVGAILCEARDFNESDRAWLVR